MPFLGPVQVAIPSLVSLDITNNSITLVWPTSYFDVPSLINGINYNVMAANIYVTDGASNTNTITLPDATQASPGSSFVITNIGMSSFRLLKSNGDELIVIPPPPTSPNTPANSYYVVLQDISIPGGKWQFVQFGAGTSQADASVLAGNGLTALSGLLNTNIPVQRISATPYDVLVTDRAKLLLWAIGIGIINLPAINAVPAGFYISVNNEGTGICTITPTVGVLIDNKINIGISNGQSLSIISDGTNWWTLGLGQDITSSKFDPGSEVAPSISFTGPIPSQTGIYYYQSAIPVAPPGIGFTVGSTQIANITEAGLYLVAGKSAIFNGPVVFNPAIQQGALNSIMPQAVAIGDIIYYDSTNNWVRLPIGTVDQFLKVTNVAGNLVPRWVT